MKLVEYEKKKATNQVKIPELSKSYGGATHSCKKANEACKSRTKKTRETRWCGKKGMQDLKIGATQKILRIHAGLESIAEEHAE